MKLEEGDQILKTRDDIQPVLFRRNTTTSDSITPFLLLADQRSSWASNAKPFSSHVVRNRIEPWLTALVQSEHLALLIGSGLTHAIYGIGTGKRLPGMASIDWQAFQKEIKAEAIRSAEAAGRSEGNFEDEL